MTEIVNHSRSTTSPLLALCIFFDKVDLIWNGSLNLISGRSGTGLPVKELVFSCSIRNNIIKTDLDWLQSTVIKYLLL